MRLVTSEPEARRMGTDARTYVEQHHDWTIQAGQLAAIYREVIAERKTSA